MRVVLSQQPMTLRCQTMPGSTLMISQERIEVRYRYILRGWQVQLGKLAKYECFMVPYCIFRANTMNF